MIITKRRLFATSVVVAVLLAFWATALITDFIGNRHSKTVADRAASVGRATISKSANSTRQRSSETPQPRAGSKPTVSEHTLTVTPMTDPTKIAEARKRMEQMIKDDPDSPASMAAARLLEK